MRSNHHNSPGSTFAEKQTDNQTKRIAPKTATLIFEPCKAFFAWAKNTEGLIEKNPAEGIRIDLPKQSKARQSRRPFTEEELRHLFNAPPFTGSRSRSRRFEAGKHVIKDAKYWIPVLGYYTGARLGEIVQMHLSDVQVDDGIPYLEITDASAGASTTTSDTKHVKSAAAVRRVPLHPDLMAMGFANFVQQRRRSKRPSTRLFFEIPFGADGQASTVFSKWFGRLLDKAGLPDPALVFHSFRHNAEDAFRDALQPQYVIDRIIGHSDGSVSSQ